MKVLPEKRKELLQTLSSIGEVLRNECGFQDTSVYQNIESENELLFLEEWLTQKDADAHLVSDIFTVLIGAGSLLLQPLEIVIHGTDQ